MKQLKFGPAMLAATLTGFIACFVLYRMLARYASGWAPAPFIWLLSFLMLPGALSYAIIYYFRYRKSDNNISGILSTFNVIITFLLAFDLYSFGWQKIFHLQMVVPLGILDLPFNSLDGETLTWAYFRRSYPFTVTIALAQISGSIMLLFKRTRLLGLIMLVPVLLNIILIDIYYHLHTWVLVHAIVLMSGIIYLLYQYKTALTEFFFHISPDILKWNTGKKTHRAAGIIILLLPLILLLTYHYPDKHPQFTGKYKVGDLYINNRPQQAGNYRDSVLTTIYMDLQDDMVLEFNHYNNRYIGTYHYDPQTQRISTQWRYPKKFNLRFDGTLMPADHSHNLRFKGMLGEDSVQMQLIYVPEPR
ncbi:hypothetical protein [Chitinophaga polysaccharea]|uniref:hypothetical protein n=1 Tax=Chitinophaga polysaccharea TaxID=1293035 RepID=UPI001158503D|nr:hypothetical protein [Chitinophaga polysaccharea]